MMEREHPADLFRLQPLNSNGAGFGLVGKQFQTYAQWQALGFDKHGVLGYDPGW